MSQYSYAMSIDPEQLSSSLYLYIYVVYDPGEAGGGGTDSLSLAWEPTAKLQPPILDNGQPLAFYLQIYSPLFIDAKGQLLEINIE